MACDVATRTALAASALLWLLLASSRSVECAKRRQARASRQVETRTGPTDEQVWDSGLIEKEMSYVTLMERGREYYEDTASRRFNNFVLGYVTPWNRAGYVHAVTFRHKLDAVAPVWFQIKQQEGQKAPDILGAHEVNQTWISELKQGGKGPLVVPRFIVEAEPLQHVEMLQNPQALLDAIRTTVLEHGFDGLVLETWAAWKSFNGLSNEQFRAAALSLLGALGQMLHGLGNKKLYLAVPPIYPAGEKTPWIETKDLDEMSKFVDGFSVMTYDFSTSQGRAGPNAPIDWVNMNLQLATGKLPMATAAAITPLTENALRKVLLGVNFYGWDFAPERQGLSAVTANDLMGLLQRHQPVLSWSTDFEEHSFQYKDREGYQHTVWYPTPRALEMRLQIAREYNVGISIWELGQGLERFFDLL
ncbi:hypothetical protein Vretimale_2478 [Volvox reticuliferus]|uniref:Chitinase domain-containing protein 1 n=1 Tax=Volvox reticuliferus TaxID=1737510 RepID=A0A8J4FZF7_9CHLO|nr:hypothetical protein Vretifemale_4882 [Volvox reticuliferus]GIL96849.1 hypothetical protein Vretimale_2478 [Volvox reticuliferus]